MFKQRGAGLRCGCWHLILPEMLESVWSHVGISHGMRDVFMSEVMLNRSRVLPRVRQLEAGRVPKHVWVDRKRNSCCSPRPSRSARSFRGLPILPLRSPDENRELKGDDRPTCMLDRSAPPGLGNIRAISPKAPQRRLPWGGLMIKLKSFRHDPTPRNRIVAAPTPVDAFFVERSQRRALARH